MTNQELLTALKTYLLSNDTERLYSTDTLVIELVSALEREVRLEEMMQGKTKQAMEFCKENNIPYLLVKKSE